MESATFQGRTLTLSQGRGWVPEKEIVLFFSHKFLPRPGMDFVAQPKRRFEHHSVPHVHVAWTPAAARPTEGAAIVALSSLPRRSRSVLHGYSLRLRFEPAVNGKITGRISLSLPGATNDYVAGSFTADVR